MNLNRIKQTIQSETGIEFSIYRHLDKYFCVFNGSKNVFAIQESELYPDREQSIIRIIRSRFPEYFL